MKQHDQACTEIENQLSLFVGGDLEDAVTEEVARHLTHCAPCTARERAARDAHELLVSALRLAERPGPDLWPGVRAALVREKVLRGPANSAPFVARRWQRQVLAYAAVAVALLGGFWLARDAFVSPGPYGPGPGANDGAQPILVENVSDPVPGVPILPVVDRPVLDDGLRLVGQGEKPLRDSAVIYGDLPFGQGLMGPRDPNLETAPVDLRRPTGH